ncbi:type 1 glutamine amidotransferase [Pulveribacter sp.]|uniref:gamma-glutamyl-gamma-aminobutyrate hydrolase family protein n=1 Tax=Pulveribacter sp. TaxID=2678893 RepID=UPI0028A63143|nr:type 1 glutamine amidotransferase [Pulveribacter sp.]
MLMMTHPGRAPAPGPEGDRLKIGLSACFSHADPGRSLFTNKTLQYVEQSIAHWLMSAGALVVMVPCPTGETARGDVTLKHYAEWLDGVVMHGGADVWPGSYGEEPMQEAWIGDRVRDLYDLAVVEAFEQVGKPIFGVCRGLQLINVAFGGTLYQDIETQHPGAMRHRDPVSYDQHFHEVDLVPGTRLAQLYRGQERVTVNSIHHQGIKDLAPGFDIEAWSWPDAVPEAIRRSPQHGRGYIAATQWHPEFRARDGALLDDTPLLHDFLAACQRARARPRPGHSPLRIRDRASRLLRQALLRRF